MKVEVGGGGEVLVLSCFIKDIDCNEMSKCKGRIEKREKEKERIIYIYIYVCVCVCACVCVCVCVQ